MVEIKKLNEMIANFFDDMTEEEILEIVEKHGTMKNLMSDFDYYEGFAENEGMLRY